MVDPTSGGCGVVFGFILAMIAGVLLWFLLVPASVETDMSQPQPDVIIVTSVGPSVEVMSCFPI